MKYKKHPAKKQPTRSGFFADGGIDNNCQIWSPMTMIGKESWSDRARSINYGLIFDLISISAKNNGLCCRGNGFIGHGGRDLKLIWKCP